MKAQLIELRNKDKFSVEFWETQHVLPCDAETNTYLNEFVNRCLTELIDNFELGKDKLKEILTKYASEEQSLDTVDCEALTDVLYDIGKLLDINISEALMIGLYGEVVGQMAIEFRKNTNYEPIETATTNCTSCSQELSIGILDFQEDESKHNIVELIKCDNCGNLNLIEMPSNAFRTMWTNCNSQNIEDLFKRIKIS